MPEAPMKIDHETRVYVRVAMRDTLEAYDLTDLLDLMADVCQNNADQARTGGQMGLPAEAWERTGVVGERGDRSVAQMVDGAVQHLAHHLAFVAEKRRALGLGEGGGRPE